jgi:hypothetical protein
MSLIVPIEGTASVELPDVPGAHVMVPQVVTFWTSPTEATVVAHFMANLAYEVCEPHAVAFGPHVELRYSTRSPSGAAAAGITLRKVVFRLRGLSQRKYEWKLKEVLSSSGNAI